MKKNDRSLAVHVLDRMQLFGPLSPDDLKELRKAVTARTLNFPRRRTFAEAGDRPLYVSVVLSGWVAGYKDQPDGNRQIIGFYLPGDTCDSSIYILHAMDHALEALTDCTIGQIAPSHFRAIMERRPRLAEAFWWNELVSASIRRQWVANLNGRSAIQRIAHLLCELHVRLEAVGLAGPHGFSLPLTQEMLANATGITTVHANRSLQELRRRGLIESERGQVYIRDVAALRVLCFFDPLYLHLQNCVAIARSEDECDALSNPFAYEDVNACFTVKNP